MRWCRVYTPPMGCQSPPWRCCSKRPPRRWRWRRRGFGSIPWIYVLHRPQSINTSARGPYINVRGPLKACHHPPSTTPTPPLRSLANLHCSHLNPLHINQIPFPSFSTFLITVDAALQPAACTLCRRWPEIHCPRTSTRLIVNGYKPSYE